VIDLPEFPDEFKLEAGSHAQALEALRTADTSAEWFYLSPPSGAFHRRILTCATGTSLTGG
jgi:putative NADH-flavin reductase